MIGNKTIVIGRLHSEIKLVEKGGKSRATFKLRFGTPDERIIDVNLSGKQAEVARQYLRIGDLVCIEGRGYQKGDKVTAERVIFLKHPSLKKESAQNGTPGASTTIHTLSGED